MQKVRLTLERNLTNCHFINLQISKIKFHNSDFKPGRFFHGWWRNWHQESAVSSTDQFLLQWEFRQVRWSLTEFKGHQRSFKSRMKDGSAALLTTFTSFMTLPRFYSVRRFEPSSANQSRAAGSHVQLWLQRLSLSSNILLTRLWLLYNYQH